MSYGGDPNFTGKSIQTINQQKQQAAAKAQQIQKENQAVMEQRAKAPGTVTSGSPQDVSIRAQEAQAAQQRMIAENVHQVGYSGDIYAKEREAAIKSGKFDYGSVRSAFYSPPPTYVNPKGERVTRPSTPPPPSGPPRDLTTLTTKVTQPIPTPPPKGGGAPLDVSAQVLARSDALRAQMGLKPLEQETKVTVVKPSTLEKPTSKPSSPQLDYSVKLRESLSSAQGVPEQMKEGEAVSFLTMPFERTLAKTPIGGLLKPPPASTQTGTKEVPAAGLVDVVQFVPFGIGIVEKGITFAKTLPEAFVKEFGPKAEEAATTAAKGSKDIGLGITKPAEQTQKASDVIRDYNRFVEASKGKEPTKVQQSYADKIISKSFGESGSVEMGTGLGKVISKGGEGTKATDVFSKPPPEKPSTPEKTVSAGEGLEQIVKQKEVTKTVTRTKPEFETKQATKQEKFLKDQEQKALQKEKPKTEQEQVQKTAIKEVIPNVTKTEEGHQGVGVLLVTPQKTKEKPKPIVVPPQPKPKEEETLIPIYTSLTGQQQKEKPKEEGVGITDTLLIAKITGTPPPTPPPPPELTPPTETPTDKKRPPPDLFGLGGSLTGGGGRGEGSGAVKAFIGNVPEASIVGVYKRGEISYGQSSFKASRSSTKKTISEKKIKLL